MASTSSQPQPLALPATGGAPPPSVRIEPAVLLSIADAHGRRPADGSDRVIGTLLGSFAPDGAVDVRDCFTVPHSETAEQVAVDISHHANLLALHRKVSTRDAVVGWFSTSPTGAPPSGPDALIHDFYSREVSSASSSPSAGHHHHHHHHSPVHVTIDTSLTGPSVRIAAYAGRSLSLGNAAPASSSSAGATPASPAQAGGDASAAAAAAAAPSPPARPSPKAIATAFVEIPLKVITADAERLGAKLLTTELVPAAEQAAASSSSAAAARANQTAALDLSLEKLVTMLESGARWCSRVASGEARPDPAAAASLADALAALTPLPPAEVEQLARGATQDAMLLQYLSKMVTAQVALSDRLGTAALPIL